MISESITSSTFFGGADVKPRRFTETLVMAEFGFGVFITYGDLPNGGMTSITVVPIAVSSGCSLTSS